MGARQESKSGKTETAAFRAYQPPSRTVLNSPYRSEICQSVLPCVFLQLKRGGPPVFGQKFPCCCRQEPSQDRLGQTTPEKHCERRSVNNVQKALETAGYEHNATYIDANQSEGSHRCVSFSGKDTSNVFTIGKPSWFTKGEKPRKVTGNREPVHHLSGRFVMLVAHRLVVDPLQLLHGGLGR